MSFLFTSIHPLHQYLIIIPPHLPLSHPVHAPLDMSVSSSSQAMISMSPSLPHPSIHLLNSMECWFPHLPFFITSLHLFLINLMFSPIFTSSSVLYFYLILIHSSNYLTLSSFIIPLSLPHSSIFILYLHFPLLDFLHLSTFSSPSLHQLITQLHPNIHQSN